MKNDVIDPINPAPAVQSSEPPALTGQQKTRPVDPDALVVSLPQTAIILGQSQSEIRRWERMGLMPPLVRLPSRGTGKARRLYWRTADIVAMIDRLTGK